MARAHDRKPRAERDQPRIGRAVRAHHIDRIASQPAAQREQSIEALRRNRQGYRAQPPAWRFVIDARFERAEKRDVMTAPRESLRLGKNAQLLPAPAERGLRMDDLHAAARSAAYWMR